jgi:hypothetical protein
MDGDIEARVKNLEAALGLPHSSAGVSSTEVELLRARTAALEKQLARANYRILHLTRALDERDSQQRKAPAAPHTE